MWLRLGVFQGIEMLKTSEDLIFHIIYSHLLSHRLLQSLRSDVSLGVVVCHLSARRAINYDGQSAGLASAADFHRRRRGGASNRPIARRPRQRTHR